MKKVIVERPRWGSRLRSLKTGRKVSPQCVFDEDYDSGPRRAPASRHEKSFNEHLGPLWRYLRSNLGRPWSKVYSEIRAVIDGRGVLGNHLLDHLEWEVETNCFLEGKQVRMTTWGSGSQPVHGFYVHPKTGLLKEAPRKRYPRRAKPEPREVVRVQVGDGRLFERFEGLWFETAYRNLEDGSHRRVLKRQCASKLVRRIDEWIRRADRGKPGYKRGVASVHAPGYPEQLGARLLLGVRLNGVLSRDGLPETKYGDGVTEASIDFGHFLKFRRVELVVEPAALDHPNTLPGRGIKLLA